MDCVRRGWVVARGMCLDGQQADCCAHAVDGNCYSGVYNTISSCGAIGGGGVAQHRCVSCLNREREGSSTSACSDDICERTFE